MRWISTLVVVFAAVYSAEAAQSERRGAVVDKRQNMQQARMNHGMRNGSLTSAEQVRLKQQQDRVMKTEKRANADGQINKKEFRRIERQQNRANRSIYRAKHN